MIDACYSGNNEGPREIDGDGESIEFKQNSMRIYASLAHRTAKEITYGNAFFRHVMPFYQSALAELTISTETAISPR